MPSTLMSKDTSIFGTPFGAVGIPSSRNVPSFLLSFARGRSPCRTTTSISSCASAEVVKTFVAFQGTAVPRSITGEKTPPSVSTPRVRGVTSISIMSLTSPAIMAAWIAAPMPTTSSGLIEMFMGLYALNSCARSCTAGILVEPPTIMTSFKFFGFTRESSRACRTGSSRLVKRFLQSSSKWSLVSTSSMCLGPVSSAVMKGTDMRTSINEDNSIFAFSLASARRCKACLSPRRSIPVSSSKLSSNQLRIRWSKSSPPNLVFPFVAKTSQTPSPASMTETSKVPPPRSKTSKEDRLFWSKPYANAAIVGSLQMRMTSKPANFPAVFVACLWESSKYAGTVMTAFLMSVFRKASASLRSFLRT
mmetsp:Transcript_65922/g.155257  ORF Transcript_65922/g.155257 Transcript_65922/m.155257 type:complete len:362 (+) Transcript_65922:320-1405(+)